MRSCPNQLEMDGHVLDLVLFNIKQIS